MDQYTRFTYTQILILFFSPLAAVCGLIIPHFLDQPYLSILATYAAIPMIVAPAIYLIIQKKDCSLVNLDERIYRCFVISYLIVFSLSALLLFLYDIRPVAYYVCITYLATVILLQILLFDTTAPKTTVSLMQIMALILNLVWGVTLKYFFYLSRTDTISHVWYIQNIIDFHSVTDSLGYYTSFPLWHIYVSIAYHLSQMPLPLQKIMFVLGGLIYAFFIPVIYLVARKIFDDTRIGLVSALFISIFPTFVLSAMGSFAGRIIPVIFCLLILLLLGKKDVKYFLLVVVISAVMILYHTSSMPFILSILALILVAQWAYKVRPEERLIRLNFLVFLTLATITYWVYFAQDLFNAIMTRILTPALSFVLTKSIIVIPMNELFNYLQYSPVIFFMIIGLLFILKSNQISPLGKILAIITIILAIVTFPGPAFLSNKLAQNFNFYRFGGYTFLFIGMAGSIGLIYSFYKSGKALRALIVFFFIGMVFLGVSNDFTASDNPLVKREFYNYYLTETETVSFDSIAGYSGNASYIMADEITNKYYHNSPYKNDTHLLEVDAGNMTFLTNSSADLVLIRQDELKNRPLQFYPSRIGTFSEKILPAFEYYYQNSPVYDSLREMSKIYSSDTVDVYTGYSP
jgi:hypothetical protein